MPALAVSADSLSCEKDGLSGTVRFRAYAAHDANDAAARYHCEMMELETLSGLPCRPRLRIVT